MTTPTHQDAAGADMRQAATPRRPPTWVLAAAALLAVLAVGWHTGWGGAIGSVGVMAAGLGLPWLRREVALGGALTGHLDPGRAQGAALTPAAGPADFAAQAPSGKRCQ